MEMMFEENFEEKEKDLSETQEEQEEDLFELPKKEVNDQYSTLPPQFLEEKKTQADIDFNKIFAKQQELQKPHKMVQYGTLVKTILLSKLYAPDRLFQDIDSRLRNQLGTYFNKEDQNATPTTRILNAAKRDLYKDEANVDATDMSIARPFVNYVSMKFALENAYSIDSEKNKNANRDFNLFSLYVASVEGINSLCFAGDYIEASDKGLDLPEIDFTKSTEQTLDSMLDTYSHFVKNNIQNQDELYKKTQYFFKGVLDQVIEEDQKQRAGISFEALDTGYSTIFGISYLSLKKEER